MIAKHLQSVFPIGAVTIRTNSYRHLVVQAACPRNKSPAEYLRLKILQHKMVAPTGKVSGVKMQSKAEEEQSISSG